MADIVKGQEPGSGEGLPSNIPKENKPSETTPAEQVQVKEISAKPENTLPAQVSTQQVSGKDTSATPINEVPVAVQDTKQVEKSINPVQETTQAENSVNSENAQPEQVVPVEEIKSVGNPVTVDVIPEQVLVQEVLVAASANKTENVSKPSNIEVKEGLQPSVTETSDANETVKKDEVQPNESGDWQQREQELLKKIEQLGEVKNERSEDGLKLELKVREEEIDLLKARVKSLETELQAALAKPGGKNQEMIEKIRQQHEELLSKARGMIFDKTKVVKNQELQIEALTTQIQSLKDINIITKDLLEIRNAEVQAMEERLQVMEARFKGEKERYDLVLKRAQTSTTINDDLRREYETQLAIFKELREKYELRVQALVAENNRLKESLQGGSSG